jgi:hypothetical protein
MLISSARILMQLDARGDTFQEFGAQASQNSQRRPRGDY